MVITLENSVKEFIANRSAEKSSAEDSVLIAVGKRNKPTTFQMHPAMDLYNSSYVT